MNQLPPDSNDPLLPDDSNNPNENLDSNQLIPIPLKGISPIVWKKYGKDFISILKDISSKNATKENITNILNNAIDSFQQKLTKDKYQNVKNYKSAEKDNESTKKIIAETEATYNKLEINKKTQNAQEKSITNAADISSIDKAIKYEEELQMKIKSINELGEIYHLDDKKKKKLTFLVLKKMNYDEDIIEMLEDISKLSDDSEDDINPKHPSDEIIDIE